MIIYVKILKFIVGKGKETSNSLFMRLLLIHIATLNYFHKIFDNNDFDFNKRNL